ncbi:MAG: hypothetical protein H7296_16075 [Bacteroidia bacterium]|nr:hypothetical protein [Bacteroidia bacterium]
MKFYTISINGSGDNKAGNANLFTLSFLISIVLADLVAINSVTAET